MVAIFVGPVGDFEIDLNTNVVTNVVTKQTSSIAGETLIEFTDFTIDRSTSQLVLIGGDEDDHILIRPSQSGGIAIDANIIDPNTFGGHIVGPDFSRYKVDTGAGDDTIVFAGAFAGLAPDVGFGTGTEFPIHVVPGPGNDVVDFTDFDRADPILPGKIVPNLFFIEGGSDKVAGSKFNDDYLITDFNPANNKFDAKDGFDVLNLNSPTSPIGLNQPGLNVNLTTGLVTTPVGGGGKFAIATNFESAHLSFGNDKVTGNSAGNTFRLLFGKDSVDGAGQPIGSLGDIIEIFTDGTANLGTGKAISNIPGNYAYSFTGIEGFIGSPFDDVLIGNGQANYFKASQGDDKVIGGAGIDVMHFFGNPQQYTIDTAAGTITDQFFGRDGKDTFSGIEIFIFDNVNVGVDPAANTKFTADYDELLYRDIWAPFWDGGTGIDTFTLNVKPHLSLAHILETKGHITNVVAGGFGIVVQDAGASGPVDVATLINIDNFIVNAKGGSDISVFGDFSGTDLNKNTITLNGDALANVFDASGITSAHRVVMSGAAGADALSGGAGRDSIDGGAGNDKVAGGSNGDVLAGGLNSDSISGGAGNDTLVGGAGRDTLAGNLGLDIFEFNTISESPDGVLRDRITDFNPGGPATKVDRIDLLTIDANTTAAGDQAFAFIAQDAFKAGFLLGKGQLRAEKVGVTTVISGEVTGDQVADFQIVITNNIALANLTALDFVL